MLDFTREVMKSGIAKCMILLGKVLNSGFAIPPYPGLRLG